MCLIIDIHCHIDAATPGAVARARGAGVCRAVCNSSVPDDWENIRKIVSSDEFWGGAVGVHPWYAGDVSPDWDTRLIDFLSDNPSFMVGEIGIDKHYPDIDTQTRIFTRQMEIAHQMHRPTQVHCVGAFERVLSTLSHMRDKLPPTIIMHSYNAGPEITGNLLRYDNVLFSYGPRAITMSPRGVDAMMMVPDARLLIESDGDNPADARRVLTWLAHSRGIDMAQLATTIYNTGKSVIKNG